MDDQIPNETETFFGGFPKAVFLPLAVHKTLDRERETCLDNYPEPFNGKSNKGY